MTEQEPFSAQERWRRIRRDYADWVRFNLDNCPDMEALSDEFWAATEAVMAGMCVAAGHDVEDDMCGKPEHRYCLYCCANMTGRERGQNVPE